MDSNAYQTVEINLKDLFLVILKKAGIILVAGLILAGALFAYKYISSSNDANVLDISEKLDGESDIEYSERVQKVGYAEDIIRSIDKLKAQIENQRQYVSDSILMQIDAENEAVTIANLVVTIEDNSTAGIDSALVSSYSQDLGSGDYLIELAKDLGTNPGYLKELIKVDFTASESVVVNSDELFGSAGTIVITVIGPTPDYTDKIMDAVLNEADVLHAELNSTMVPHVVVMTGRQSSYMVDNVTRDMQYDVTKRFETLQKQIDTYDDSLEELASDIGVDNKSNLYAYFAFNDDSWNKSVSSTAIKFAVIGFAVGIFIIAGIIIVDYLFGKKFSSQAKFYSRFPRVEKLGVVKPTNKRSAYIKLMDKKSGDDNSLSDENNYKLMAANIKNLTSGMEKILFIGTAETERIKDLVSKLGVKADVKSSFFEDPTSLESISGYDGIIIVEQRNYSNRKMIAEELRLIDNADTKLIGAIVI